MKSFQVKILLLSLVLFFVLQPRLPSAIFRFVRHAKLNSFVDKTISKQSLDTRSFWEFREFYYPGTFKVHQEELEKTDIEAFLTSANVTITTTDMYPILVFNSRYLQSFEALVNVATLKDLLGLPDSYRDNIILSQDNLLLFRDGSTLYIIFLASIDELKNTNGFINRDYETLKKFQSWLSITKVTY